MTDLAPLRAGDTDAWQQLLDQLLPRLRLFVLARVGPDLVDDVIGDVLLEVWRSLPTYEDRGHPISAWIWRITHARTIDALRRAARRDPRNAGEQALAYIPDTRPLTDETETYDALWARVRALPPSWATVLVMRFADDLSPAEVAQRVGLSVNAVKALQHRAITRLRRERDTHDWRS